MEVGFDGNVLIWFDLIEDLLNNYVVIVGGEIFNFGVFLKVEDGSVLVFWYLDFKCYDMGEKFVDLVDVYGFGVLVWLMVLFVGVGFIGLWFYDGNVIILEVVILVYGGEVMESCMVYEVLIKDECVVVVVFLENLIIIDLDFEEEEEDYV